MNAADSVGSGAPDAGGRPGKRAAHLPRGPGVTLGAVGSAPPANPLRRVGLASRILPFALLAVLAEASLALPPGPVSALYTALSVVLLAATVAAVLLVPWSRLPAQLTVGVPLLYTASVLLLILASGGTSSGITAILLLPLTWTALFHRPWESGCVIGAILAVLFVASYVPQEAPLSVIIRRMVFWGALATVIAVAAHGLRSRIIRSQGATARLQNRLRELSILQDRDRIASRLQDTVVQRLFAAGLSLQGIGLLSGAPEVSRRIDAVIRNLDEAILLLRESIFGLEQGLPEQGLRRSILDVTGELTPLLGVVPEVTLDGPIDTIIPPAVANALLIALREALGVSGVQAGATKVAVAVVATPAEVCLSVTDNGARWPARAAAEGPHLASLRERARRLGGVLDIAAGDDGARLTWQAPLPPAGATTGPG